MNDGEGARDNHDRPVETSRPFCADHALGAFVGFESDRHLPVSLLASEQRRPMIPRRKIRAYLVLRTASFMPALQRQFAEKILYG